MKIRALGIMSGTSLDGVDLALCEFRHEGERWEFDLLSAQTIDYSEEWKARLVEAPQLSGLDLVLLNNEYGRFLGQLSNHFLESKQTPDIIASHGHTIFHQPEKNLTYQLGNGASIAATTGIDTVSDFRNLDVALNGQGAPLVPIGDRLLFPDYEYCLNIGGFANISYEENNQRVAFDIGPANLILNNLASEIGAAFDRDGAMGRKGKVNPLLLDRLNALAYYHQVGPKSLGREWCVTTLMPLLKGSSLCPEDQAATFYEHLAMQIAGSVLIKNSKILTTGGGAKNNYLLERINHYTVGVVIVPDMKIVDFKEAIIFAFLGVLRSFHHINCLSSVTGAKQNNIGGVVFKVKPD